MTATNDTRPVLKLLGANGNVFNLLGLAHKAARKANWPSDKWDEVRKEATSGDYDQVLQTLCQYFNVE